jgi:hypothetical protein
MSSGTRAAICDDQPMRKGLHAAEFTIQSMDRTGDDPILRVGVCVVNGGFQRVDPTSLPEGRGRIRMQKEDPGFDPRKGSKAATNTKLGWGYNVTDGKLRHMGVDLDWKGMRPARNNDRIKLVLDSDVGSLTLFLNGVRLGELVGDDSNTGLPDLTGRNLAWLVELDKQGDSVLIGSV